MMKKPLIWAHRGASGHAPENTLPAFDLAAKMGADGVELDVQMTKDGEIVVCHDETINRTSSGKGRIKEYTLTELKQFDFSYGNLAYEGVQIPTLEEVMDLLDPTGLTINIEIKTGIIFYPEIERKLLDLARRKNWEDRVIYSSFNHETLRTLHQLDPSVQTGILYADGLVDVVPYAKSLHARALHPAMYNLQYPGFLEQCAEAGIDIHVWTINSTEEITRCIELGVHAIITNYPEKVKKILSRTLGE